MPLEYPVTKPYTLPGLTVYVSAISVLLVLGLATLNFVLQGYETVTALRSDPNVTELHRWRPSILSDWESARRCDPVSLSGHTTFRTNSSLFSYEIRSIFDSSGNNIAGATSYMANPLNSCEVEGVVVIYGTDIDDLVFETPIRCTGTNIPFSLSLFSTFKSTVNPYQDDFSIYYNSNRPASASLDSALNLNAIPLNASSLTNVVGIVDVLSADFLRALMFETGQINGSRPIKISSGIFFSCSGGNATCEHEDKIMTVPVSQTYYLNGTMDVRVGPGPIFSRLEQSMTNMLIAVKDAYHIDLGNIRSANTLLSREEFEKAMKPDKYLVDAMQSTSPPLNVVCSVGVGCSNGTTWVERLLSSDLDINVTLPTILAAGDAPAVIKIDYLCPSYKLKNAGSLVTSVFIGTWSMYMALFGAFGFIGPILERRYGHREITHHQSDLEPSHNYPGEGAYKILSPEDNRSFVHDPVIKPPREGSLRA